MNKTRRKPTAQIPQSSNKITPSRIPEESGLTFSFKYLEYQHSKFSVSGRDSKYFIKLLERLKGLSSFNYTEFMQCRSTAVRSHPIKWEKTSEPCGFRNLNEQLQGCPPYQFEVSANEHGRVHGFMIEPVFYVVWLDPDHKLYPS